MGMDHCAGFAIPSARSAHGAMFNYRMVGKVIFFFLFFCLFFLINTTMVWIKPTTMCSKHITKIFIIRLLFFEFDILIRLICNLNLRLLLRSRVQYQTQTCCFVLLCFVFVCVCLLLLLFACL